MVDNIINNKLQSNETINNVSSEQIQYREISFSHISITVRQFVEKCYNLTTIKSPTRNPPHPPIPLIPCSHPPTSTQSRTTLLSLIQLTRCVNYTNNWRVLKPLTPPHPLTSPAYTGIASSSQYIFNTHSSNSQIYFTQIFQYRHSTT